MATFLVAGGYVMVACSSTSDESDALLASDAFEAQRRALIEKLAPTDGVFDTLNAQVVEGDEESAAYWRWRTDQYLYGQYPEYQAIYDAYTKDKSFNEIYGALEENLGPKKPQPAVLPELPDGYFSDNLLGNPHTGWHHVNENKVYITYQGELTDPYIARYDLVTQEWQGPIRAAESTLSKGDRKIDSHGRPIIEQDSEGHLHIVYGGHGGEREDGLNPMSIDTPHAGGRMLHVRSVNPHDISKFEYVDDISPFASYTKSYTMANGDIYLFTRAGTHKSPWVYYKMKSGETRFEPPVVITWPTPQIDHPINVDTFYISPLKVSDTEIAISYLWHECNFLEIHDKTNYSRINTYYMRMDTTTDTFYNAQGEAITLPITLDVADASMLAFDSTNRKETPFSTRPIVLDSGAPAVAYLARINDFREWRMTTYNDGTWTHSLPMPGTVTRTLVNDSNQVIDNVLALEPLKSEGSHFRSVVVYKDTNGTTHFAEATSINGNDWVVTKVNVSLTGARFELEPIKNNAGQTEAVLVNIRRGGAQRLYLWQDGEFRAPKVSVTAESFENGGWNAASPRGFTPGLDPQLDKNFMFNQMQSDEAFTISNDIVRHGNFSARLFWHQTNPASFNGNPSRLDNVDRKAMFHGYKSPTVMGAEAWYGFSFYFPSQGTQTEDNAWLFFQIHGSADKHLKEHSRNPPFSLTLDENGMRGAWKWDPHEDSPTRNGDGTEIFRLPGEKQHYLDRWVDFVLHVKVDYSDSKRGLIELWVDGEKVLNEHNVQFGYNDVKGIYPSWGMYFNGDVSVMRNDHYLYLDDIKMSYSSAARYEHVAPSQ
ncbi:hypothetical protein EYS00_16325 [Alteromonas sp. KUL49]|nr:hypothetical protein EYS00_16325 [Alteromonas sp. KUL49]